MSDVNDEARSGARHSHISHSQKPNSNSNSTISNYLHRHGYRLGKIIGEGSYSKVRLTTRYFSDGTPAYRLASKVINKKRASEDFVTKFLPRELQIVSRLEHPNIVRVYDVVEFDDHVYIFMDWCDKGDLLEYVKAKGFISEPKGQLYFRQLMSAVRYLHNLDLSHRDLKCENILMASQDQIRVSDFGFARSCRDAQGKRILSNTYCGSAAYAAPEILQGTSYNPKLYDMWSLGCVLFIMLTGHMPYDESNIQRMLKHQIERTLTYPAHVYDIISPAAKTCIRRLLEPDVTRRANIEQAIGEEWVTQNLPNNRPSTAALPLTPATLVAGEGDSGNNAGSSVRNNSHAGAGLPRAPIMSPRTPHGDHRPHGPPQQPPTPTPVSQSNKKPNLPRNFEADRIRDRVKTPTVNSRSGQSSGHPHSQTQPHQDSSRRNVAPEPKKIQPRIPKNVTTTGSTNPNVTSSNSFRPSSSRGISSGGYTTRH